MSWATLPANLAWRSTNETTSLLVAFNNNNNDFFYEFLLVVYLGLPFISSSIKLFESYPSLQVVDQLCAEARHPAVYMRLETLMDKGYTQKRRHLTINMQQQSEECTIKYMCNHRETLSQAPVPTRICDPPSDAKKLPGWMSPWKPEVCFNDI